MAGWNGSGVFARLYSWVSDAAAGIDISASRMDSDTDNITLNGFGNCLTRDGQGSATANQPMNGFKHTGVGSAVDPTDYVALGQLQPGGTLPGVVSITPILGEMRQVSIPEALLATLAPGWHICAGGTRLRTDPLWLATGAVSAGNWAWGNGNGTTTYTLPDFRGRAMFGKDDMGGAAANRLTNGVSGVNGLAIGAAGGDQHAQADTITTSLSGSVSASSNSVVTESPHSHSYTTAASNNAITAGGNPIVSAPTGGTTGSAVTGLTVATSTTITNTMGVSSSSSLTGSSQNIPPAAVVNTIIYTGA